MAALALARALKAESVFYGEYQRSPDGGLTLTPRLLDVKTGEGQALEPIIGKPGQLVEAQADVIQAYVKALKLGLKADEVQRMVAAAKPTTNVTAFEAFAKGRRSALRNTQEGNEGAAELLARAVEVDPTFALAHYQLGMVHLTLGNRWKAAAQFRAATQVDPSLADPYKALGDLFMSSPRRLYDQAIEAYEKAVVLRPHYAEAQVGLGDNLDIERVTGRSQGQGTLTRLYGTVMLAHDGEMEAQKRDDPPEPLGVAQTLGQGFGGAEVLEEACLFVERQQGIAQVEA